MPPKKKTKITKTKKTQVSKSAKLTSLNLHQKYRPPNIDGLLGQDAIQKTVNGWIKSGDYPSTIMITGMTGSGKTTTARMIHYAINCADDEAGVALGKQHPDYKELNMGELGRIEDVRNMLQTADVAPQIGKKKIIVLDESHLMTKAASSALLKPLEEPAPDTIWILCTTDPEKMLDTVNNRCTKLVVKPIAVDVIKKRLQQITIKEGVKFESKKKAGEALELIANFSEGQMRKALSQLQSLIGAVRSGEKFESKSVLDLYASTGEANLDAQAVDLLIAILTYNLSGAITICNGNDNPRGLVAKMQWLVDWVIQSNTGTMKFSPYIGKLFNQERKKACKDKEVAKDFKESFQLPNLINIMDVLLQINITWNTAGISERMLLTTWIAKVIANDYEYTVNR